MVIPCIVLEIGQSVDDVRNVIYVSRVEELNILTKNVKF